MGARAATGPAHVAVVSFLAARAAPTGGFWIALAGGVALARVAERRGARLGFGASVAAMLETVAIIGPARLGVPLTQAVSAPILGRLHARGVGIWPQLLACATVRLLHNAATAAFFIWVIAGGLDAYAGTYDAIGRRVGIEVGSADALALTLAGLLAWAAFASTVQVLVYRRGLRAWAAAEGSTAAPKEGPDAQVRGKRVDIRNVSLSPGRFDPRAVAAAALVAFVLLLSSTAWALLAAVLAWLALAWLLSRPDREPIAAGLLFAAVLAGGRVRVRARRRPRTRHCAATRRPGRAARARGHLAACGGTRERAARGLAPSPRPPATPALGAGSRRRARRDRIRGSPGGRRPRAGSAPLGCSQAPSGAAGRRAHLGDARGGRLRPARARGANAAARPRARLGADRVSRRAGARPNAYLIEAMHLR